MTKPLPDRITGRMRRLTRDPDRWVDSDMQRNDWLLVARQYVLMFAAAVVLTVVVIALGIGRS